MGIRFHRGVLAQEAARYPFPPIFSPSVRKYVMKARACVCRLREPSISEVLSTSIQEKILRLSIQAGTWIIYIRFVETSVRERYQTSYGPVYSIRRYHPYGALKSGQRVVNLLERMATSHEKTYPSHSNLTIRPCSISDLFLARHWNSLKHSCDSRRTLPS